MGKSMMTKINGKLSKAAQNLSWVKTQMPDMLRNQMQAV
jgi:hypothetical protein